MTIENFQQEVNAMFPCRWEDDFVQDVQKTFDIYISHVSGLDKIKEDVIGEIKALCPLNYAIIIMFKEKSIR